MTFNENKLRTLIGALVYDAKTEVLTQAPHFLQHNEARQQRIASEEALVAFVRETIQGEVKS